MVTAGKTARGSLSVRTLATLAVVGTVAFGIFVSVSGTHADAGAVSLRVKLACRNDYKRFCSDFAVNSPELRDCMRSTGDRLSSRCIQALIDEGEVTDADIQASQSARR